MAAAHRDSRERIGDHLLRAGRLPSRSSAAVKRRDGGRRLRATAIGPGTRRLAGLVACIAWLCGGWLAYGPPDLGWVSARLSVLYGTIRGVVKTTVTRYTRLRCPRSGTTPAGWLRTIFGGYPGRVDRARPVLIRIHWVWVGGGRRTCERAGRLVARVLDEDELIGNWTLVGDQLEQLSGRRGAMKLGFALLLRFYAVHGRFPAGRSEIPDQALRSPSRSFVIAPASCPSRGSPIAVIPR